MVCDIRKIVIYNDNNDAMRMEIRKKKIKLEQESSLQRCIIMDMFVSKFGQ